MMRKALAGLLMGLVALGWWNSAVLAQEAKEIPAARQAQLLKRYPQMDNDKDGKITRPEMRKFFAQQHNTSQNGSQAGTDNSAKAERPMLFPPNPARFLAAHPDADVDKDGKLSPREMRAYLQAHGPEIRAEVLKMHPEADTNKDGVLGPEEFRALIQKSDGRARIAQLVLQKFPQADTDKNGTLSPEEMRSIMQSQGDAVRAEILQAHPRMDRDKDGVLSVDEFSAAMRALAGGANLRSGGPGPTPERVLKRFPEADTDKDGKLSDEEMKAFMKSRDQRPGRPKAQDKARKRAAGKSAEKPADVTESK